MRTNKFRKLPIKRTILMLAIATGINITYAQEKTVSVTNLQETPKGCYEEPDTLAAQYESLDELVVAVKKDVVKSDGAKLTYDLEQEPSTKGSTLLDVLRKVPMVTVDGDDNIYIKGSSNFKVYLNGKEEPMLSSNAKTIFKSMPAESVAKIEVITEPGAKYDAEGVGGILNLITERKQRKDGYTANATIGYTSQNTHGNIYGRMKYNKVSADAMFTVSDNSLQGNETLSNQETINQASEGSYRQAIDITQRNRYTYYGGNINLSWEPTDRDLFTMGGNVMWVDGKMKVFDKTTSQWNRAGETVWSTFQKSHGLFNSLALGGNASYRRLFDDKRRSLTTAYQFNFGNNKMDLYNENNVISGELPNTPYSGNYNANYKREHTVTLDYEEPFNGDKHKLEAGAKGVFRRNNSDIYELAGETSDHLVETSSQGNMHQLQDIYALYASYTGNFRPVNITAGFRYEHTYMGMNIPGSEENNFHTRFNDIVPNAAVTYMLSMASNLRLAYQQRITRPGIDMINPTEFKVSENIIWKGNPDLKNEQHHNITLTYNNFDNRTISGNVTLGYSLSNNKIDRSIRVVDDIQYTSYDNIAKSHQADLSGFLSWNINSKMSASVNASAKYVTLESQDLKKVCWGGGYGANFNYTGPWDVKYGVYGGQQINPHITLQSVMKGYYYYGLFISKSFLEEKNLTVTLHGSNFLTKYQVYKSETIYDTYRITNRNKNRQWNVGVSISYNIGKLSDRVKKTNANLENNDLNSKSDNKGGISL
ncbi:MAG: TonB-dependent receptor domain-containing protein [Lepagella sp.]